jgi:hypothetical protein
MWYGRRKHDWQFATMCDYGSVGRRTIIMRHYSPETAEKAWHRMKSWYGPLATYKVHRSYRVWQVDRAGNIINDTGVYGHRNYSAFQHADNVLIHAT